MIVSKLLKKAQLPTSSIRLLSTQGSHQPLSPVYKTQGDKQAKHHDHYRFDAYNDIRHDKKWQSRIIKREEDNFERWVELVGFHYENWRKQVFARSDPQIESIPEKYGQYIYFLRQKEFTHKIPGSTQNKNKESQVAGNYEIYCRHKHDLIGKFQSLEQAQEQTEVILDIEEVPFISQRLLRKTLVDKVKMNDDHSLIAFTLDIGNTEKLTAGIKDMKTNEVLRNFKIENVGQVEFANGERPSVFYTETDEMGRPYKVKKREIYTQKETTVFIDTDPTHYVDISLTKDRKYLLINSNTKEDSEVWVMTRGDSDSAPTNIIPRRKDIRAHVDHLRDQFIMITNYGVKSKNYKIATLKDEFFGKESHQEKWEDLLTSKDSNISGDASGFIISEFDGFKDFIAIYIKNQGRPEILIQDLDTKKFKSIKVEDVGEIIPGLNQDYESKTLRYQYTSPFIYQQIYDYNHETKTSKLLKDYKLLGSPQIVRNQFECKQFMVPSHDGEQVPLNVYYKKGITLNRKNRTLIEAYGAYGINLSQGFNIVHTTAMEKGWVIAQAMVRGGGEKGIQWHESGKILKKPNSFKDFAACAEYLIAQRITHPNLLASKGASAGGTLIAQTCLNTHPDLFRACVLNVPFLDVLSTLLDDSLPLSVTDYLEFGNPILDEKVYKLLNSISPYENLSHQEYPSSLFQISLNDPRVPAWSSLKFIEKLRDMAKQPERFPDFGGKNIVVKINKEAGHFGDVENDVNLAMETFEFAWLDYIMFKKNNAIM